MQLMKMIGQELMKHLFTILDKSRKFAYSKMSI